MHIYLILMVRYIKGKKEKSLFSYEISHNIGSTSPPIPPKGFYITSHSRCEKKEDI